MRKKIGIIIAVVCGLLAAAALAYLIVTIASRSKAEEDYSRLASSYASGATADETAAPSEETTESLIENPIDFASLKQENSDTVGWITVPDTNVNYPVLQSWVDDNFYIDHGFDREYSFPGAIYMQLCNRPGFSDRVTVLYGHNMRDGSMFASLHSFEDSEFFDSHESFTIYTENRRLTYRVVSAFVGDDSHIINSHNFGDDRVFEEYCLSVMNPHSMSSNVRSGVKLNNTSKLLILSTCNDSNVGRYLVVGELIASEPTR